MHQYSRGLKLLPCGRSCAKFYDVASIDLMSYPAAVSGQHSGDRATKGIPLCSKTLMQHCIYEQ